LGFCGFSLVKEPILTIEQSYVFEHRRHVLYGGFNHNHLRILRSLNLFGLAELAKEFLERLKTSDRDGKLPSESVKYRDAAVANED
jgi:hypothetical protein